MKILLIIPAYNEEANILKVYQSIQKHNQSHRTKNHYDCIVINDCSTDSTSAICHKNHIPVIDLIHNLGIGGAVQTGYKYALAYGYDIAVQFDGDGQHDVACIEDIIQPIVSGRADFVIGSRFVSKTHDTFKSSAMRRFGIKIIYHFMRFATGTKIYDGTSGFRAASRPIIAEFAASYPIEYPEPITDAEIIKKGYRIREVPVSMNPRTGGTSSITSWKTIYYMINVCLTLLVIKFRRYQKCQQS